MANSEEIRTRITAFVRELALDLGEVDESLGDCWLDAVENQAVELRDAISVELARQLSQRRAAAEEAPCPQCGAPGRYLTNQRARMDYAEYRRLGLPITSSHVESTVKQINRRLKGTEKFWNQGAEPLLVLAADHLSETNRLDRFWKNRRKRLQSMRCYQTAT